MASYFQAIALRHRERGRNEPACVQVRICPAVNPEETGAWLSGQPWQTGWTIHSGWSAETPHVSACDGHLQGSDLGLLLCLWSNNNNKRKSPFRTQGAAVDSNWDSFDLCIRLDTKIKYYCVTSLFKILCSGVPLTKADQRGQHQNGSSCIPVG